MQRPITGTLVLLLALVIVGCSDLASTPDVGTDFAVATDPPIPSVLLSGQERATLASAEQGFASPLFDLATAPNGDILVADAGAGISTLDGTVDIALPGVSSVASLGRSALWATIGLTGDPGDDTGQALVRASKGEIHEVVDLFAFEEENNPDGQVVDSNPFDVASLGGRAALVADSGGNTLLRIDNQGHVEVSAVFPNELVSTDNIKSLIGCPTPAPPLSDICELPDAFPAQAVPTSVAVGPDGNHYVGELKGFPAPTNASHIWQVSPHASGASCPSSDCTKAFDGGFTSIIDLEFGPDGMLYVVELDEQSWFAVELAAALGMPLVGGTINACDIDTWSCTEVARGIPILTAITFGKGGSLWATKNALIPALAEVVAVP